MLSTMLRLFLINTNLAQRHARHVTYILQQLKVVSNTAFANGRCLTSVTDVEPSYPLLR